MQRGGEKTYDLLHRALSDTGKVEVAKVATHSREYLAAVNAVRTVPHDGADALCSRGFGAGYLEDQDAMTALIQAKVEKRPLTGGVTAKTPSNIVDLVSILQKASTRQARERRGVEPSP